MSSKYDHSPPLHKPWKATAPIKYERCQYTIPDRAPELCGEPSFGRPYCEDCRKETMKPGSKFHGGLTRRGADA